jgi:hypothetical protein
MAQDCVVAGNIAACGSANVSVFCFISCDSGGEGGEGGRGGRQTHSNRVPCAGCCERSEVSCAVRFADPDSNSETTYALESFRAVGLNLTTSGWLSPG